MPPSAPSTRMTDGIGQVAGSRRAPSASGRARGTLPGRPPPVMWAMPADLVPGRLERRPDRQQVPRVDAGGRQQDVAQRGVSAWRGSTPSRLVRRGVAERPAEERLVRPRRAAARAPRPAPAPASSRSRGGRDDASPTIASPGPGRRPVQQPRPLADADAEPRQVELVGLHQARVLRRLAADQRAARLAAAVGDPRDQRRHPLRVQPPDRDVVEERQRLGAGAGRRRPRTSRRGRSRSCPAGPSPPRSPSSSPRRPWTRRSPAPGSPAGIATADPNPPRPPSTSGRRVDATEARISSTARSPAATSTPARA